MRIGVIVAMDKEFAQLQTLASDKKEQTVAGRTFVVGSIGDNEIVMQKCGIGKVNAAVGASELIAAFHPGVAGGADTSLEVCEVVVSTACCYHDVYCGDECAMGQVLGMPERFESDARLVATATSLNCHTRVHAGLIVTGDWFVNSREKMQQILDDFPTAMAVDMESCSIAQTCHIYNTPFVSFRIISDTPGVEDHASQYADFWGTMAERSFLTIWTFLSTLPSNL